MVAENTNVSAFCRTDDNAIIVSTDAYVTHKKKSVPWRSTFSMSLNDAIKLRGDLSAAIRETQQRLEEAE